MIQLSEVSANPAVPPVWPKKAASGRSEVSVAVSYTFDTLEQLNEFVKEKGNRIHPTNLNVVDGKICLLAHILEDGEYFLEDF